MLSIMPVTYALPTGMSSDTASQVTSGTTMTVTGTTANNVINWNTFSIAKGETVNFDANNYLNLVTGSEASSIYGALNGTGNIYLINSNGILIGSTAAVNVGSLVLSTRPVSEVDTSSFSTSGTNPILTTASSAAGNITNLGKIVATKVVLEGNTILLKSTSDITSDTDGKKKLKDVTIKAAGMIEIGYENSKRSSGTSQTDYATRSTDNTDGYDASWTARKLGYTMTDLSGTAIDTTDATKYRDYMLVHDVTELQAVNTNPAGYYFLANDIDASSVTSFVPISGSTTTDGATTITGFTGDFNGLGYSIAKLTITDDGTYGKTYGGVGLFGKSSGSIENITLVSPNVTETSKDGSNMGALVGDNNGLITNVTIDGGTITGFASAGTVGGVVGINEADGVIGNVVNSAAIVNGKRVGGIAGQNKGKISLALNKGTISGTAGPNGAGGIAGDNLGGTLNDVSNTADIAMDKATRPAGAIAGVNSGTITYVKAAGNNTTSGSALAAVATEKGTTSASTSTDQAAGNVMYAVVNTTTSDGSGTGDSGTTTGGTGDSGTTGGTGDSGTTTGGTGDSGTTGGTGDSGTTTGGTGDSGTTTGGTGDSGTTAGGTSDSGTATGGTISESERVEQIEQSGRQGSAANVSNQKTPDIQVQQASTGAAELTGSASIVEPTGNSTNVDTSASVKSTDGDVAGSGTSSSEKKKQKQD
jgi:filamentous hemagglutinin family protein